ncbi:hypothetical protein BG20_I2494, partial [Candidatus Nitrosarchaeum limnium BG20]
MPKAAIFFILILMSGMFTNSFAFVDLPEKNNYKKSDN